MDYQDDYISSAVQTSTQSRPRKRPRTIADSPSPDPVDDNISNGPSGRRHTLFHGAPALPRRRASIDVRYPVDDMDDDDDDMDIDILDTPTSPRNRNGVKGTTIKQNTNASASNSTDSLSTAATSASTLGSRPIRIRAILSSAPSASTSTSSSIAADDPSAVQRPNGTASSDSLPLASQAASESSQLTASSNPPLPPTLSTLPTTTSTKQKRAKDLYATLTRALDTIHRKDQYRFFSEPVDTRAVPTYLAVISHPMDFGTMREKVKARVYKNLAQFEADFWLVINNCKKFNEVGSIYWREADKIEVWGKTWFDKERGSEFTGVGAGEASGVAGGSPGPSAFAAAVYEEASMAGGSPGPKRSARLRSKVDTRGADGGYDAESLDALSSSAPLSLAERAADMFEHTATKRYTTTGTLAAKHLTTPPFLFAANGALVPPPEASTMSSVACDLPLQPAHAAMISGHAPLLTSLQPLRNGSVRTTYSPAVLEDWFPFDDGHDDFGNMAKANEDEQNEVLNEYSEMVWGGALGEAYAGSIAQFVRGMPEVVQRHARERLVQCSSGAASVAASVMAALVVPPPPKPRVSESDQADMDVDGQLEEDRCRIADGWASRLPPLPGEPQTSNRYVLATELGNVDIATECTHALATHSLIDMNYLATDPNQGWNVTELQGMLAHSLVTEIRQQVNARDAEKLKQQLDVVGRLLASWRPDADDAEQCKAEVRLRLLGLAHQLPAGVVKPLRVCKGPGSGTGSRSGTGASRSMKQEERSESSASITSQSK